MSHNRYTVVTGRYSENACCLFSHKCARCGSSRFRIMSRFRGGIRDHRRGNFHSEILSRRLRKSRPFPLPPKFSPADSDKLERYYPDCYSPSKNTCNNSARDCFAKTLTAAAARIQIYRAQTNRGEMKGLWKWRSTGESKYSLHKGRAKRQTQYRRLCSREGQSAEEGWRGGEGDRSYNAMLQLSFLIHE